MPRSSAIRHALSTNCACAQGPIVYGAKLEDRIKASDKVKVVLATATLMNKPEQHQRKEQAWNHSAEVRVKGGEDDKLHVGVLP